MLRQTLRFKTVLALLLGLSLLASGVYAREGDNRGDRRGDNRGRQVDNRRQDRGDRYHYRDGRWYRQGWFGWEFAVAALTIGALVDSLPPQHTTVVIENTPYYYDNNVYYRQLSNGAFVVVQPPALVSSPVQPLGTVTINVPNSRGGYTAVNLTRSGSGYIGPQGEYYQDTPSVEQLRALYGR